VTETAVAMWQTNNVKLFCTKRGPTQRIFGSSGLAWPLSFWDAVCWVSVSCSAKGLGSSIDCHVSDVAQVISREKSCWSSFEAEQPTLRRFDLNKEEFLKPCCNNEANGTE